MFRQPFGWYNVSNPWTELDRLQREVNRLFENRGPRSIRSGSSEANFPAMNIWANDEGVVVTAELAGVEPDDLDISVSGDTLTISGSRQPETLPEGATYHRRERNFGQFSRTFQFPFVVEADGIEAHFQKGVLQLRLPRAEAEKPKKIAVQAA